MKTALIPGTFDPFTIGHLELVKSASALFDKVVVCIFVNPNKTHLFDYEGDLYGQELVVEFYSYRRAERKFASLDALQAQLSEDLLWGRKMAETISNVKDKLRFS